VSSLVMPVDVLSTKESPDLMCSATPSTETSLIQSNLSPSAVKSSWFSNAHNIGDAHPPCPMPYNSFLSVDDYVLSDTP
jgi:hypothetical protein